MAPEVCLILLLQLTMISLFRVFPIFGMLVCTCMGAVCNNTASLPFNTDFETSAQMEDFFIVDANADGCTWYFDNNLHGIRYSASPDNRADDWLISPPFQLIPGHLYRLTAQATGTDRLFPEILEARLGYGSDVTEFSTVILNPVEILTNSTDPAFIMQSSAFTVSEEGIYNFAMHIMSDAAMRGLTLNSLQFEQVAPQAPQAVIDLLAVADPNGLKRTTVSFRSPTFDYAGNILTEPLQRIDIFRNDILLYTFTDVQPGSHISIDDTQPGLNWGINRYSVIPYMEDNAGETAVKRVFVGYDVPKAVDIIRVIDNRNYVSLNWNVVDSEGMNGGPVNSTIVYYNIYKAIPVHEFGQISRYDLSYLKRIRGRRTDVDVPNLNSGDLEPLYFAVGAESSAGEGPLAYVNILKGSPVCIPYIESFAGGMADTYFEVGTDSDDSDTCLLLMPEPDDPDGGAAAFVSEKADAPVWMRTAKIDISGTMEPTLRFRCRNVNGDNSLNVSVLTPEGERTTIFFCRPDGSYTKQEIDLSPWCPMRWIRLEFSAEFDTDAAESGMAAEIRMNSFSIFDGEEASAIYPDADKTYEAFPCDVYAPDGTLIRRNTSTLEGLKGIFIVNGHKVKL